jgi:ABC-type polysaccharide/polyol phosphate export permease
MNLKIRYKSTYLGFSWAALEPLFMFGILYIVFSNLNTTIGQNFPIYLMIGVMFYHLFTRGTMMGLSSIKDNSSIIKSLKIEKEIFPVISSGSVFLMMLVEVAVLFSLMPLFGFEPSWTVIYLPVLLGLFMVLILGMSYILSVLFVYVRDLQPVWSVFVYSLIFVSPVFWYVKDTSGILQNIHAINPLGQIIELGHKIVFGQIPDASDWLITSVLVFSILFVGFGIFKKFEKNLLERL